MSKDNYINTDQIRDFVKTSPNYYVREFEKINNNSKFVLSFNLFAFLFAFSKLLKKSLIITIHLLLF